MNYPFRDTALSREERVRDLVARLTLDEKVNMLSTWQHAVPRLGVGEWHIGGEVARGYVSRDPKLTTTVLPQPIGMAGMFDPELMKKLGRIAGVEARIIHARDPRGHLMLWGPTVDACRDPRWGRNEESYGEDPFLTGEMTKAYTKGMAFPEGAEERKDFGAVRMTIPTLKHFYANNNERERLSSNSNIDPRTKNEYYHEFFRRAIEEGGADSMMACYNELNGVPGMLNPDIRNVVKDKWGLGFVVTDGGDFTQTVDSHHYTKSHAETLALALKAGTDIMTDNGEVVREAAYEALARGLILEEDIDRALMCSLSARFALGEFDPPESVPFASPDPSLLDGAEHRRVNHRAALEQFVLLKNDGMLPLKPGVKIAVLGDVAGTNYMDWYTGFSSYDVTIVEGLKERFGAENVIFDDCHDHVAIRSRLTGRLLRADAEGNITADGESADTSSTFIKADWGGEVTYTVKASGKFFTTETMRADSDTAYRWFNREILRPKDCEGGKRYVTYFEDTVLGVDGNGALTQVPASKNPSPATIFDEETVSSGIERGKKLAAEADIVIACVGNQPMIVARECFDRTTLSLPPHESGLVRAAAEANRNILLAVVSSYPYAVQAEEAAARAALYTTHAGPELGRAFAEVVLGEFDPAGRLAQTWYVSEDELPSINDYDIITNGVTYLYYEGRPLYPFGYGLSYTRFEYSNLALERTEGGTKVSFDVKNTGGADGAEVPQVYFRAVSPRVKRPRRQLCAFERVEIMQGETAHIEKLVPDKELRFYDVTRDVFCVESGEYEFMVGASSEDIRLRGTVKVEGEVIPPRDLGRATPAVNFDSKEGSEIRFSRSLGGNYMHGGTLTFRDAELRGETSVELHCSTQGKSETVRIFALGREIGGGTVPATSGEDGFTAATVPVEAVSGRGDVSIVLGDSVNLVEFKFA